MKLFRKPKSKFYWYDFTVGGHRYRGSTQEPKSTKAAKVASLKLARAVDGLDPVPGKAVPLAETSRRFLDWLDDVRLEDKTKTFYRDGWRLLKATTITDMRRIRLQETRSRGLSSQVRPRTLTARYEP